MIPMVCEVVKFQGLKAMFNFYDFFVSVRTLYLVENLAVNCEHPVTGLTETNYRKPPIQC